ncbi:hypothetical protein P3T36_005383 [Kitasatospora sp. MAP12-15]|uniref:alpha/beta hydrolase n=1 Tax=unclassified Kitasatospora TaxID=2633591 RepID=UPI00351476C0
MLDVWQLQDAQPELLAAAGQGYEALAEGAGRALAGVHAATGKAGGCWTGPAALQAQLALAAHCAQLEAAHLESAALGALLRDAASEFGVAREQLLRALADAERAGCAVAADGTVSAPPPGAAERHDGDAMDARARTRQAIAERVAQAVRAADDADRRIAERLDRLAAGDAVDPATAREDAAAVRQLIGAALPPASAPPAEVTAWWRALPPGRRELLVQQCPELVGNRDGIPAEDRDRANRIALQRCLDGDAVGSVGFRAIRARLDQDAGRHPPTLLLGLSGEGLGQGQCRGRGILCFGNPDTARNISAYVPGVGTELEDIAGRDGDRALNVWTAAHAADPARETASLVWLGYDPPPDPSGLLDGDLAPASVLSADRARDGAASYDRFLAGLRATHQGPPAHLTALGHSYGSLTVGLAGQRPGGTGADDLVLIGSPGTEADHAARLGLPADHVWVGAAAHDPVTHLPSLGDALTGNELASDRLWFGPDPAAAAFGANRFTVADGPLGFASHSHYLDPSGGDSLPNIGQIVAGHPENVHRRPGR